MGCSLLSQTVVLCFPRHARPSVIDFLENFTISVTNTPTTPPPPVRVTLSFLNFLAGKTFIGYFHTPKMNRAANKNANEKENLFLPFLICLILNELK